MLDKLLHRWLRIPYQLYVHVDRAPKKPKSTVVFLHGIGNTGAAWDHVIDQMPKNQRVISLDLLGFGRSPKPDWAVYSVKTQSRSVIATLLKLRLTGKVVLVGHSLGSLVAVEVTKRYPLIVRALVLCSPPFYDQRNDSNRLIRAAFRRAEAHPERFVKLANLAARYNLINKSFGLTSDSIHSYLATLGASILTQTSLQDAQKITKPIIMLYGSLDPFVKKRNLKAVQAANPRAELRTFVAAHEIRKPHAPQVAKAIADVQKINNS